ncbi:Fur-regulated basic protein FbpA [Fictibacillus terranigra]|uniref:Fur-regulated basic protein FbpA n=1 Tax=Fictibacillus terranigra TaxID=3058424 RepID=A0ABT8ED98_9BACL|nr:Fur-regulated basic protein FbpA [Fictibacillus sp. CENA-BCM004]MDN4075901.1 Fur-regulated basic protein FbpA [Fictibacillus sp. CENA-BCM004]
MEVRRHVLILNLLQMGVWKTRDGRRLTTLRLDELEREYSKMLDKKEERV